MTPEQLLADLRQHDSAMDKAPWFSAESKWQSDCVLTGAPDVADGGCVVVQSNPNFPYRANLDGIAFLGTHRGELLALAEEAVRLRAALVEWRTDIDAANLDDGWSMVERIDQILGEPIDPAHDAKP